LKIDYRYSKDIVYNNFPWPNPTGKQKQRLKRRRRRYWTPVPESPKAVLPTFTTPCSCRLPSQRRTSSSTKP
jgi:hypothetical protein